MRLTGLVVLVAFFAGTASAGPVATASDNQPTGSDHQDAAVVDNATPAVNLGASDEARFLDTMRRAVQDYDDGRWLGVCPLS